MKGIAVNKEWSDIGILEDYLEGKLDAKEMHRLEKLILEDPFVAQAMAGLEDHSLGLSGQVSLLQKQLYERTAIQHQLKKTSVFTWQRLSVGAAAAVMFITVSVVFLMREKAGNGQLKSVSKEVEVNLGSITDSGNANKSIPVTSDSLALPESELRTASAKGLDKPVATLGGSSVPVETSATTSISPDIVAANGISGVAEVTDSVAISSTGVNNKVASARIATAKQDASAPVKGWAALDTYLNDNKTIHTNEGLAQIVELSFQINAEGKPINFRVLTSAGKDLDQEAIKLLSEGPLWEKTSAPETRINYTVAF